MTPRTTKEAKDHPTLHERMLAVSQEASYVHRDAAPEKGGKVIYTAATYDAIVSKIRPVLVKHGILAYPDHDSFEATPGANGEYGGSVFIKTGLRFVNADDPSDFIVVPACAMSSAGKYAPEDQAAGRAMTYAYKSALRYALLLETGDDPDFEAARGGAEVPPEIQERIDKVMDLALTKHEGDKEATDAYVRNVLDGYAKEYNRPRILTLAGLTVKMLDKWLAKLHHQDAPQGPSERPRKGDPLGVPPAPRASSGSTSSAETTVLPGKPGHRIVIGADGKSHYEPVDADPEPDAPADEQKIRDISPDERGAHIIAWLSQQRGDVPQGTIRNAFGGWMFQAKHRNLADDATWLTVWAQRETILADLDKREAAKA